MPDCTSRPITLECGDLRAALQERYGNDSTPGHPGTRRCEQLEAALDVAQESGALAMPDGRTKPSCG